MTASTLSNIFATSSSIKSSSAITIPQRGLDVSHERLRTLVVDFQDQLGAVGIGKGDVVSACLTNTLDLVLAFLATGGVRSVLASFRHPGSLRALRHEAIFIFTPSIIAVC